MSGARPSALAVVLAAAALLASTPLRADGPPGFIRFTAGNALSTAHGEFRAWKITAAVLDEGHPETSSAEVVVDVASLDTGNADRDAHLKTADFFDVAAYPTATVRLGPFRVESPERITADVTLELHGRRKTFPMTFRVLDRTARRVAADVAINRTDFGIGEPDSWVNPFAIDDEVQVSVEVTVPE